ncbi:membrane protein [Neorhizobium galegae]|uniref:Membrane protein 22 n=1 Tax=Neorhizobium galegae bv. officinalis TaxID=323656 RepID=A0A0T7GWI5_NEOGA|nr:membrane protein [Neorhizobium galegae]CDZ51649.1 Membrane protein 22 [Neorhizobium galegae bv. officinalis]
MPISSAGSAIATPVESSKSAIAWGPIFGGAVAATGISLILILFGSGLGLTMISPWSGESSSAATVGISAAIWLVVVQWLSAALGGYLTGRLRTKWAAVHTDEVFFRDTAHGFVSWAVATVFVAGFLASSLGSLANTGAQAVGSAASTAGIAGTAAAASSSDSGSGGTDMATSYFTDALLRPQQAQARAQNDDGAATAEVSRILLNGAVQGGVPEDDKAYLATIVAARTGLSPQDARARVDAVLKRIDDAKVAAQKAADEARKAAATTALVGSLSLLVGAFISSAAAALGGRQRDEEEDLLVATRY